MTEPVDVVELVKELAKRPRGRACIVLTHEYKGQKDWAKRLAGLTGSEHIDLLDEFAADETLAKGISTLSVSDLFDFLHKRDGSPVLIVTGIEFLRAAWSAFPKASEEFASHIEMWVKSPALLFVLPFDQGLANRTFTRFPHQIVVVDQENTLALP
jgi:hypothetical protein